MLSGFSGRLFGLAFGLLLCDLFVQFVLGYGEEAAGEVGEVVEWRLVSGRRCLVIHPVLRFLSAAGKLHQ